MFEFCLLSDSENGRKSRRKNHSKRLLIGDTIEIARVFRAVVQQPESVGDEIQSHAEPKSSIGSHRSSPASWLEYQTVDRACMLAC